MVAAPADTEASRLAALYGSWGLFLVKLGHRSKKPIEDGWNDAARERGARVSRLATADERRAALAVHVEAMARHVGIGGNVGLAIPDGVLVVDADSAEAVAFLESLDAFADAPAQATRRGRHYVMAAPEGSSSWPQRCRVAVDDGVEVDLRLAGKGQIAVEPSVHPDGDAYQWIRNLPAARHDLPAIPLGIVDRIKKAIAAKGAASAATDGKVATGSRNDHLTAEAGRLVRAGFREDRLLGALSGLNSTLCEPPLPQAEVAGIVASAMSWEGGEAPARIAIVAAADIAPQPLRWVWRPYLPAGKIVDAYGDGDMGKSMILLDLAARVTTGAPMPDGTLGCEPGNVLIFAAEDDAADTIVPRLRAAGADLSRAIISDGAFSDQRGAERWISLRDHLAEIRRWFAEVRPKLAIFDPVMAFLGSTKTGIDSEVREALGPLKNIAAEHLCTIINLRHINKASGASANMRGTASTAFRNIARAGLVFGQHPEREEQRVMAPNKNNLSARPPSLVYTIEAEGPDGPPRVVWHGPCDLSAGDILGAAPRAGGASGPKNGTKVKACAERIREWVAEEGAVRAAEIEPVLRAEGYGSDTIKAAKTYARVVSERDGEGWFWRFDR